MSDSHKASLVCSIVTSSRRDTVSRGLRDNGMISKSPKFAVGGTLFAAQSCD